MFGEELLFQPNQLEWSLSRSGISDNWKELTKNFFSQIKKISKSQKFLETSKCEYFVLKFHSTSKGSAYRYFHGEINFIALTQNEIKP